MNNPAWLDASELDESIAGLDAIAKPADQEQLEEYINDALYWYASSQNNDKRNDFATVQLRARALQRALYSIGEVMVKREIEAGRNYVEP